jgi:hypothetical protein
MNLRKVDLYHLTVCLQCMRTGLFMCMKLLCMKLCVWHRERHEHLADQPAHEPAQGRQVIISQYVFNVCAHIYLCV